MARSLDDLLASIRDNPQLVTAIDRLVMAMTQEDAVDAKSSRSDKPGRRGKADRRN